MRLLGDAPNCVSEVAIVAARRANARAAEAQVVGDATRGHSTRPVVAARPDTVQRACADVAATSKEQWRCPQSRFTIRRACNTIFGSNKVGQRWVSSWNSDYKMLNHIRWVRNQIAHDSSAYQISKPGDLQFVQEYYERIITGQDSLALLQKVTKAKKRDAKQQKHKVHSANNSSSEPLPPKMNAKKGVLGCVAALIIVSGIILLLCITR